MPSHSDRPRIALASCHVLPEPDPDFRPLAQALSERGCEVENLPWDHPNGSAEFDVCVLRSTWNYYHAADRFLGWVDEMGSRSRLINSPETVRWNIDKRYLCQLQKDGVEIVETVWFEQGQSAAELAEISQRRGWKRFVIKPVISAASYCTRAFGMDELGAATAFLSTHLADRSMMAQPFMSSVETVGEKSIVWIDGLVTHAWIKRPRFAGQHESAQPTEDISRDDRAIIEQALQHGPSDILYARIDLMYEPNGKPRLSELELIEPSLYFDFSRIALDRFADAIVRQLD